MTFTWFDALLFGIMFISAVLALMRGFTREVLSLLAWGGGAIAVVLLHPILLPTAKSYFPPDDEWVAAIVLGVVIFLVVLIIISLLTMRVSDWILDNGIGVLDRTLGFVFGVARGLLLVVVAYMFFIWAAPRESHPDGLRTARSLDLIESTVDIITQYLPVELAETFRGKTYKHSDEAEDPATDDVEETVPNDDDASLKDPSGQNKYDAASRSGFNQLLESTQNNQN